MITSNDWYSSFLQQNKGLIITHIIITLLALPLEIYVYAVFSRRIFQTIQEKKYREMAKVILLFILFLVFLQFIFTSRAYVSSRLRESGQIYIRQNYLNSYLEKNDEDYSNSKCIHEMDVIPYAFFEYYNALLMFWTPIITISFFFTIFAFWIGKRIGFITLVFFALFYLSMILSFKSITRYANDIFYENEDLLDLYEDIFVNNETIRSTNTKTKSMLKMKHKEQKMYDNNVKLTVYVGALQFSLLFLLSVFFVYTFFLVFKMARKNNNMAKFIMYCSVSLFVLNNIFRKLHMIYRVSVDKGSLDTLNDVQKFQDPKIEEPNLQGYNVSVKNLSFSRGDKKILENLSFNFPENSTTIIKGSIGCGKSTFMKLLLGWYTPTAGSITIGSVPLENIPVKKLRETIYMMSQNTALFSGLTVLENIFYPNPVDENLLVSLKLPSSFQSIYKQKVIKHGANISGGQKRLVHVLRAWLHPATIVIMDEPIDNIDKNTMAEIVRIINQISEKKTLLCISHIHFDLNHAEIIDFDSFKITN